MTQDARNVRLRLRAFGCRGGYRCVVWRIRRVRRRILFSPGSDRGKSGGSGPGDDPPGIASLFFNRHCQAPRPRRAREYPLGKLEKCANVEMANAKNQCEMGISTIAQFHNFPKLRWIVLPTLITRLNRPRALAPLAFPIRRAAHGDPGASRMDHAARSV